MSNLTKWENRTWNPFKEMEDLERRLFSSFFGHSPVRSGTQAEREETMTLGEWTPAVDITEDDKEYLIKAELPEVKKEDLKLSVENGVLLIRGERKFEKEEKGKRYHRVERAYGNFVRSFTIPEDADESKISAEFRDGILEVRLAKNEKARPKSIEVKVG